MSHLRSEELQKSVEPHGSGPLLHGAQSHCGRSLVLVMDFYENLMTAGILRPGWRARLACRPRGQRPLPAASVPVNQSLQPSARAECVPRLAFAFRV